LVAYTFVHMPRRNPQLSFLKSDPSDYGGELLKTRKGRRRGRPLDTRSTMHLVLRSSRAKGEWSFRRPQNMRAVREITTRFSKRYGIRIISAANVGNHLHFHIKLGNRYTYAPFIRAITAAIAMRITGASRWNRMEGRFWDYRPFTRVVRGLRAFLTLRDYIRINQLEGRGYARDYARWLIERGQARRILDTS
jgi:REP element-mobilizing transposase RayT